MIFNLIIIGSGFIVLPLVIFSGDIKAVKLIACIWIFIAILTNLSIMGV